MDLTLFLVMWGCLYPNPSLAAPMNSFSSATPVKIDFPAARPVQDNEQSRESWELKREYQMLQAAVKKLIYEIAKTEVEIESFRKEIHSIQKGNAGLEKRLKILTDHLKNDPEKDFLGVNGKLYSADVVRNDIQRTELRIAQQTEKWVRLKRDIEKRQKILRGALPLVQRFKALETKHATRLSKIRE